MNAVKQCLSLLSCDTYILLTKREGHTGRIWARGLDSRDPAQRGPYKKRPRADIFPVRSQTSEVIKRFITRLRKIFIDRRGQRKGLRMNRILTEHLKGVWVEKLFLFCKPLQRTNRVRDHSRHYPVQYLENIGPATEQSNWLVLVIGSLAA